MKKKLWTLLMLLYLALPVMSQDVVSTFLEEVDDDTRKSAMQMTISGRMLRFAAANDSSVDKDMKRLMNSISRIRMVAELEIDSKQVKQLDKLLKPYEELMSITEEDQQIKMYTLEKKDVIIEFVLCIVDDDSLTLISIQGEIDLELLSRLSESVNIEGMEHLDKVNDNDKKKKK